MRTQLFGAGGVALIALLILAAISATWETFVAEPAMPAMPAITTFDVAPPVLLPRPVIEKLTEPKPELIEQPEPLSKPELLQIEPPQIALSRQSARLAEPSQPEPSRSVEPTTAPESQAALPVPSASKAAPNWQSLVLGRLNQFKRYPREAQSRRQQGVPYIRFVIDRQGKVLSINLERGSGYASLDREALDLPRRAQPFPPPPEEILGETVVLIVPVEFLHAQRR